jgi:hypothetical protein
MNIIVKKKLQSVVDNNLPLIQNAINQYVLPKIQGSLQERKNQIYAFQLLYKTLDKTPIINIITTFVNEDDFIEFCMPHAEKYLGLSTSDESDIAEETDSFDSELEEDEEISIDKLFVADELIKLKELVDIDAITLEEFNEKKTKIIGMEE